MHKHKIQGKGTSKVKTASNNLENVSKLLPEDAGS